MSAFQPNAFQPNAFQEGFKSPSGGSGVNYTLDGSVGTYTLTGQSATVKRGYSLSGAAGTYTLTGQNATVKRGYSLSGSVGTYTLTGQNATVKRGYSLSGNVGTYTFTGQDATATYTPGSGAVSYTLDGLAGVYSLVGQSAEAIYVSGAVSELGAAGRIKRTRILLEHRNKRLFFDSESEVLAFLEAQRESATESLKTLGNRIVVEHGKPVLKARPHIVKVKTDDEDVKKLVDLTNRQIQAEFDRYREMILKVIARQIEEDEEEVLIALML